MLQCFLNKPVTMVSPDLDEPAYVVDQTCQRHVRFRSLESDGPHLQASHRPFHEPEDVFYAEPQTKPIA